MGFFLIFYFLNRVIHHCLSFWTYHLLGEGRLRQLLRIWIRSDLDFIIAQFRQRTGSDPALTNLKVLKGITSFPSGFVVNLPDSTEADSAKDTKKILCNLT